jgi:peroxiredoxin
LFNREIPDVTLKTRVRDETVDGPNPFRWQDLKVREEFAGKKVVVFSLPGAFTPTCSNEQCPNYDRLYDAFQALGVDDVYCISVNDAFVMYQWGQNLGLKNVKLLPDGSGEFTRRMGMLINKDHALVRRTGHQRSRRRRRSLWRKRPGKADRSPYQRNCRSGLIPQSRFGLRAAASPALPCRRPHTYTGPIWPSNLSS